MSQPEEDLREQVARLAARVAELEERVANLESGPTPRRAATEPTANPGSGTAGNDELAAAIGQALEQLGEGDVAAIRQQLIKNGLPATLSRSDVNKALYNNKTRFVVDRQEGVKPIWKLA